MENTADNPWRLKAITYDAPDLLKVSKPHDTVPKSEHFYFWGDDRLRTTLKLYKKTEAITRKVDADKISDPATIEPLLEGRTIILYYIDDWDEANNSISFYAQ